MSSSAPQITSNSLRNEIQIGLVIKTLYKNKLTVILSSFISSVLIVIFALLLPNIYKSEALLAPVSNTNNLDRAIENYGGLAALAGINLPTGNKENRVPEALSKISSLSFFSESIYPNIFLPNLMALKSWSPEENELIYDANIFDISSKSWTRKIKFPQKPIPSVQESFKVFNEIVSVKEDKKTGFVKLSVEHYSPFIAKKWVELIFTEINKTFRESDKINAQRSIAYLNKEIINTNLSELRLAFSQLIENQTQKLMLVEVNEDYIFKYVDAPVVKERKFKPRRAIICIFGAIIGFLLGCIFALRELFQSYFKV